MKTFKLKQKHFKDITQLLIDVGAVNATMTQSYPSDVYISREDFKKMEKEVTKAFKKEYPFVRAAKLKSSVAMHMLNYSPNESLADAIRPGYVLVDNEAIETAKRSQAE